MERMHFFDITDTP